MLIIEKQVCRDRIHHHDCVWHAQMQRFPDTSFNRIVGQIKSRVRKTGTGYRILNKSRAQLATIKKGHDGQLWVRITARGAGLRNYILTHRS